jgi:hypothetical protein
MLKTHRSITLAAVAILGLSLGLAGCKKKTAKEGGAQGAPGSASMEAMEEDDMGQPPPRPVERGEDGMDPEPMDPDPMSPPDREPADGEMAAADPSLPTEGQAAARMILIPWKDAENVVEELKRTKEEAKALAETVLKEAKAKPTEDNFSTLVKKHSAGPTKESGGKVGPFGPKDVPAYIAKAVFALKKGGISDLVETPSGFHIFMRTE